MNGALDHVVQQRPHNAVLEGDAVVVANGGPHAVGLLSGEVSEERVRNLRDLDASSGCHIELPDGDTPGVATSDLAHQVQGAAAVHQERHTQRVWHLNLHLVPYVLVQVVRPQVARVEAEDVHDFVANGGRPNDVEERRHESQPLPALGG